jgi:hypothetical protein
VRIFGDVPGLDGRLQGTKKIRGHWLMKMFETYFFSVRNNMILRSYALTVSTQWLHLLLSVTKWLNEDDLLTFRRFNSVYGC